VGDQHAGLVFASGGEESDELAQVLEQRLDAVGVDAGRLVGEVVSAQVEGDGPVVAAELVELRAVATSIRDGEAAWKETLENKLKSRAAAADAPASLKDKARAKANASAPAPQAKAPPHDPVTGEVKETA